MKNLPCKAVLTTFATLLAICSPLHAQDPISVSYKSDGDANPGDTYYWMAPVPVTVALTVTDVVPGVQGIDPETGLPSSQVDPDYTAEWEVYRNENLVSSNRASSQKFATSKYGNAYLLSELLDAGILNDETIKGWSIVAVPYGGGDYSLGAESNLSYAIWATKKGWDAVDLTQILNLDTSSCIQSYTTKVSTAYTYDSDGYVINEKLSFTPGSYTISGLGYFDFDTGDGNAVSIMGSLSGGGADLAAWPLASSKADPSDPYFPAYGTLFVPKASKLTVVGASFEDTESGPSAVAGTISFGAARATKAVAPY
jgi:hypothetical protein